MKQEDIYVGIDVGSHPYARAGTLGVRGMSERLACSGRTCTAVLLEATGGLEVPLVSALAAAAYLVVNPRQVRDFAKATGKLAKTDALDAQVLAHFAEAVRPPVRPPTLINSLTTRRSQLMTMLVVGEESSETSSHSVHPSIRSHISWLEQELLDIRLCVAVPS